MTELSLIQALIAELTEETRAIEIDKKDFQIRIEKREQALADKRVTIRVLQQRNSKLAPMRSSPTAVSIAKGDSKHQQEKSSLPSLVLSTMKEMPNSELTSLQIFEILSANGIPLPSKPRIQISTTLSRLAKRGHLVKLPTIEGGSIRYRLK